jgi:hypothetical protein
MTQKDKDLLLKDLCARLPYGVKIQEGTLWYEEGKETWRYRDIDLTIDNINSIIIDFIKPYLFPLSSMTDEQYENFLLTNSKITLKGVICSTKGFEFLNKHHFDYRGLIPMGLAKEAINGMYN